MNDEVWKPIPGYGDHYEASSIGRIRVKDRIVVKPHSRTGRPHECRYKGHVLSAGKIGPSGHRCVTLTANGMEKTVFVHTLILLAFVGPRPDGMEACHGNGDALDNRPENLRWDTHLANNRDRLKHGTYHRGSAHHMAKLKEDDVRSIRRRHLSATEAAKEFAISASHAYGIIARDVWKGVE